VVVGDLVEEAEEGDLVKAEPRGRVPGADVHDGDDGGGEHRQHQPLPEVAAAGETPALVSPHLWGRSRGRRGGGGGEGLGIWRAAARLVPAGGRSLGEFDWEQWRRLTCGVGYRISRPTLKSPGPQVMTRVVREVVKCRHMINLLSAQNHMLNLLIYSIFGFICLVECLLYSCHDCIKISLKYCLRN